VLAFAKPDESRAALPGLLLVERNNLDTAPPDQRIQIICCSRWPALTARREGCGFSAPLSTRRRVASDTWARCASSR
jgi:hypothetical protein